jgi:ubiquinone/menaquinone biosynthesis C-methylase UbiE
MADVGKGFDRLAAIYDGLAKMVYGKSIRRVQTHFLSQWPKGSRVLIIGGGTGWFLEEVLRQTNPELVCYVDVSAKMLKKSRERIENLNGGSSTCHIDYCNGTIHELENQEPFDIIVTHFYLDMFNGEDLEREIETLKGMLRPGGLWSLTDFAYVKKGWMQPVSRFLVGTMFLFFRVAAGIGSRRLEDFPALLEASGLQRRDEVAFFGGMMKGGMFVAEVGNF